MSSSDTECHLDDDALLAAGDVRRRVFPAEHAARRLGAWAKGNVKMRVWLLSHYDALKDFAGPVATIFAALVATAITAIFALAQFRIAKAQKDIALDKLKFDLLERRNRIYEAAKGLIEYTALHMDTDHVDSMKIKVFYVTIDEARFYFDLEVRDFLKSLTDRAEAYYTALYARDHIPIDDPKWSATGVLLAGHLAELRKMYSELPGKFERALRFSRLQK
jgi:hypothetical protein